MFLSPCVQLLHARGLWSLSKPVQFPAGCTCAWADVGQMVLLVLLPRHGHTTPPCTLAASLFIWIGDGEELSMCRGVQQHICENNLAQSASCWVNRQLPSLLLHIIYTPDQCPEQVLLYCLLTYLVYCVAAQFDYSHHHFRVLVLKTLCIRQSLLHNISGGQEWHMCLEHYMLHVVTPLCLVVMLLTPFLSHSILTMSPALLCYKTDTGPHNFGHQYIVA
jgi:hypothetical protein